MLYPASRWRGTGLPLADAPDNQQRSVIVLRLKASIYDLLSCGDGDPQQRRYMLCQASCPRSWQGYPHEEVI